MDIELTDPRSVMSTPTPQDAQPPENQESLSDTPSVAVQLHRCAQRVLSVVRDLQEYAGIVDGYRRRDPEIVPLLSAKMVAWIRLGQVNAIHRSLNEIVLAGHDLALSLAVELAPLVAVCDVSDLRALAEQPRVSVVRHRNPDAANLELSARLREAARCFTQQYVSLIRLQHQLRYVKDSPRGRGGKSNKPTVGESEVFDAMNKLGAANSSEIAAHIGNSDSNVRRFIANLRNKGIGIETTADGYVLKK